MFLDGSDGEQSDVLIFTDAATLLHTHANIAFDNATAGCAEDADGWLACDPAAELRIVRIYTPDRGTLGVRVLDGRGGGGGAARASSRCRTARDSEDDGRRERAYVHSSACGGNVAECAIPYIWPSGYTFVVAAGDRIHIDVGRALTADDVRHDLFTLYSEPQLPPTSIKVTVSGDDLLTRTEMPCEISSTHTARSSSPRMGRWCRETPRGTTAWAGRRRAVPSEFSAAFDAMMGIGDATAETHASYACSENSDAYCMGTNDAPVVVDALCPSVGGVGCNIYGHECCRLCDVDGYARCDDRSQPFSASPDAPPPPPLPPFTAPSPSTPAADLVCDDVWDALCDRAGVYGCGARIEWLQSQGAELAAAKTTVATECADDCAPCMPKGSADVEGSRRRRPSPPPLSARPAAAAATRAALRRARTWGRAWAFCVSRRSAQRRAGPAGSAARDQVCRHCRTF